MSDFVIRVELRGASPIEHGRFHDAMRQAGFATMITAASGKVYHLPTSEYVVSGSPQTSSEMCAQVKALADSVRTGALVLVTDAIGWSGSLTPIE